MVRSPQGSTRKAVEKRTRSTGKSKTRTARLSGASRRRRSGMKKVLLGAFLLGSAYGALQTDQPWRGGGIIPNIGLVTGSGLVVTLLVTMVWSLPLCASERRHLSGASVRRRAACSRRIVYAPRATTGPSGLAPCAPLHGTATICPTLNR
jgi:hypothetical protein